jgi:hypothetical protein
VFVLDSHFDHSFIFVIKAEAHFSGALVELLYKSGLDSLEPKIVEYLNRY